MTSPVPFLVRFSEPREDSDNCPGFYSFTKDLWIIREKGALIPFISSRSTIYEAKTITRVERERED